MPQNQIRGSTQILAGSISVDRLFSGWDAPFLQKDGSVALTADWGIGGFKITSVGDAINDQDVVNFRTLKNWLNGVGTRANVRAVATANIALTGTQTIDTVVLDVDDEVLLTAQTATPQNGPWVVKSGSWVRPAWWAAASSQKAAIFFVEEGSAGNDNSKWTMTTNGTVVVDTTAVTITKDADGTSYLNGNGLSLTGATFAVKNGNGIGFDGSQNVVAIGNGTQLISVTASGIGLTNGTANQLIVMNAGATAPVWVSMSGDAAIAATGALTISTNTSTGFLKYSNYVANEIVAGTVDGSNVTFTLANTPVAGTVMLYLNGDLLRPGAGHNYTISGLTITMASAPSNALGYTDLLMANYLK
jgi:hypothetical protein